MATFSIWTHPATGQQRVYINGVFGNTKVWIEACDADSFGFEYTIKARNDNRNRSELENDINHAERLINEAAGAQIKTFEEVLKLAK